MRPELILFYAVATVTCFTSRVEGGKQEINDLGSLPQLFKFDDFSHCLSNQKDNSYCLVTIKLQPENASNTTKTWSVIKNYSSNKSHYRYDLLRHGVCLSNTCDNCTFNFSERITEKYNQKFKNLGLVCTVEKIRCENENSKYVIDKWDYVFALIVSLYVVSVIILVSSLEIFKTQSPEKYNTFSKTLIGGIITCFSVSQNWHILTQVNFQDHKEDFVLCMQGLRYLTAAFVIGTHTGLMHLASPVLNPQSTEEVFSSFVVTGSANGAIFVQIFFVIGSWLLITSLLEKMEKADGISFRYLLLYLLNKYLRFFPSLALVVGLHSTWLVHVTRGPFWDDLVGQEYRRCRQKWWLNLLFINNFFTTDGLCVLQSWYMAAYFQLIVVTSIIVWLLQKRPRRIVILAGLVTIAYIISLFCYLFWHNREIAQKFTPELTYNLNFLLWNEWNFTWTSTYFCVPSFAVGSIFGYIFWKYKSQKVFKTKSHVLGAWILCLSFFPLSVLIYIFYSMSDYYSNNKLFAITYGSLYQTIFSVGVASTIFGISQGHGGIFKKLFENRRYQLMANLSYNAYVVHYTIAMLSAGLKMQPSYTSAYIMCCDILTTIVLSFLVSIVLTLFVQMPLTILSKKMMFMVK